MLFNSLIEFVTSGLLQSPESINIEALNGFLRLSCAGASGTLEYSTTENLWRLRNAGGAFTPIMSGVNGVAGPDLTLEAGANVTITPDYNAKKIIISSSDVSGIQAINGLGGPALTIAGSDGLEVVSAGNTITISNAPGAYVVGASGAVTPVNKNVIVIHNLGTEFITTNFMIDGGSNDHKVFIPGKLEVLDTNRISFRLSKLDGFFYTIIGLKG